MWLYVTLSVVKFREKCGCGEGVRRMNNVWNYLQVYQFTQPTPRGAMRGEAGEMRKDNECTPVRAPATVFLSSNFYGGCVNTNLMI